jgi:hypothetical protein
MHLLDQPLHRRDVAIFHRHPDRRRPPLGLEDFLAISQRGAQRLFRQDRQIRGQHVLQDPVVQMSFGAAITSASQSPDCSRACMIAEFGAIPARHVRGARAHPSSGSAHRGHPSALEQPDRADMFLPHHA